VNKTFINTICLLLIFGLLVPSLALASLTDFASSPDCKIKNILRKVMEDIGRAIKKFLSSAIKAALCKVGGTALVAVGGTIAAATAPTIIGPIIGGIISGIGALFSRCGLDKTQDAPSAQLAAKELVYDVVGRCVGFGVLQQAENSILELARKGGRDGGETWVTDWRNLQLEAQYRGEGIFRGTLASSEPCDYFGNDLKRLFGANQQIAGFENIKTRSNNLDSFQTKVGCTLPNNFNYNAYKQDFSGNGGWEAWSRLLEPQNNFYGALFQSIDESNNQRAIEEAADINQVVANRGFTGISGNGVADSCLVREPSTGRCLKYKDIKTPGSVVGASVDATVQSTLDWVVSSDEFNELMGDITERLISRLVDLSAPDKSTPVELLFEGAGGPYAEPPIVDPEDACIDSCYSTYCVNSEFYDTDCSNAGPEFDACVNACFEPQPIPPSGGTCQSVTEQGVMSILLNYPPTDAGIQQGVLELQSVYGSQVFAYATGGGIDKIDFGGGMVADVISDAGGANPSWSWLLLSACGGGGGGAEPASLLSDLQAERANYGTPMTPAELGQLLNTVAWNNRGAGWGLSGKDFGNFCPSPVGSIACDILHHQPTNLIYDVFTDSEGAATPTWGSGGPPPGANRPWVAPVQP